MHDNGLSSSLFLKFFFLNFRKEYLNSVVGIEVINMKLDAWQRFVK